MSYKQHFLSFVAFVAMLVFPASAWASDQDPKEGIDYFIQKGPNPDSTYFWIKPGANLNTRRLFEKLGTDIDSFRADNTESIPLCERSPGMFSSPNPSNHKSLAAWNGCPTEKRYLYALPSSEHQRVLYELSGRKMLSFEKRDEIFTAMARCKDDACMNEQLVLMGKAPKYGTGSAPATTTSPATPDPKAGSATSAPAPQGDCDQKCLLDKLAATGWKAPAPTEKIVETPRQLTFSEAYGIWFAGGIGTAALALTIFLAYLIRSHRSEREEQTRELIKAREDYVDRDRELSKFRNWLKEANAANKAIMSFLKDTLAKDLGVRLEPDAEAPGLEARVNLMIKAFESNAQLRLAKLISELEHLGVTAKHLADRPFTEVLDGICRRASVVNNEAKSARNELAASVESYSQNTRRIETEHAKAMEGLKLDHVAELGVLRRKHEDELKALKQFELIKEHADQLKIAYDAYAAVKNGLEAKKAQLDKLSPYQQQAGEADQSPSLSSELESSEGTRSFDSAALILRSFRERALAALQTDIGDLTKELEKCTVDYQRWLNQMEIHLGVPLSQATAEAMANDALNEAGQKLAEAIALREENLMRERELVDLAKEIKVQEKALLDRDRELDARVENEVGKAVSTLSAQLQAKAEELEALHRAYDELHAEHNGMLSSALQAPSVPSLNGSKLNGNGNGNGAHVLEYVPKTQTMPLGLGDQGGSSPFDDLLEPLKQFNIDASTLQRPRLGLAHIAVLNTFLNCKYELASDVFKRIDDRVKALNGGPRASSQEDALTALYDATLGEAYQLFKNLPFLLSASGGVSGRNSAAPSPTG